LPKHLQELDLLDQSNGAGPFAEAAEFAGNALTDAATAGYQNGTDYAYGAFIIPRDDGIPVAQISRLELLTPRGVVDLRLDGPMQVATGVRRLVKPRQGQSAEYQFTRSHPALVAIGDVRGRTTGLHTDDIAPLHTRWETI
jgi:hypothetical protein